MGMGLWCFYPGSHPGEQQSGTAMTFDEAGANFERPWKIRFPDGRLSDW